MIYLSEALFPTKAKLITDFLLGGTLALLGQVVTHSTQDVHTIHLRTLSKIVRLHPVSGLRPKTFRPR
jgi:hypothetical protein